MQVRSPDFAPAAQPSCSSSSQVPSARQHQNSNPLTAQRSSLGVVGPSPVGVPDTVGVQKGEGGCVAPSEPRHQLIPQSAARRRLAIACGWLPGRAGEAGRLDAA